MALAVLVSAVALRSHRHAAVASEAMARRIAALQPASTVSAVAAAAVAPETDFVHALGAAPTPDRVVQELERACVQAHAVLASVLTAQRASAREEMGRVEIAVLVRGPYPAAKQVLKRIVERFPQITVQRLRMRHGSDAASTESDVLLSLWSAPRL